MSYQTTVSPRLDDRYSVLRSPSRPPTFGWSRPWKNNESEAVRALLRENVDVTTRQADGTSALMWAAHWDDLETADILIKAGAEVNTGNDHGVTPLSLACRNGSAAMVEKLLDAGAHPNVAERTGETPLMTCALTGSEEAINSLLARGANVNAAEDRRGQTALMWAAAGGHADIIKTLIERGTDIHAKTRMAEISVVAVEAPDSDPELVQRTGANVNAAYDGTEVQATARGGFTAFLFAAQRGDVETARVLTCGRSGRKRVHTAIRQRPGRSRRQRSGGTRAVLIGEGRGPECGRWQRDYRPALCCPEGIDAACGVWLRSIQPSGRRRTCLNWSRRCWRVERIRTPGSTGVCWFCPRELRLSVWRARRRFCSRRFLGMSP